MIKTLAHITFLPPQQATTAICFPFWPLKATSRSNHASKSDNGYSIIYIHSKKEGIILIVYVVTIAITWHDT